MPDLSKIAALLRCPTCPGKQPISLTVTYSDGSREELIFPPRHTADFRSVWWAGVGYFFTAAQAAVVELLWNAWDNGMPELGQHYLLTETNSHCRRLCHIFKDHPAWGTMIIPGVGSKGTFRLNDFPNDLNGQFHPAAEKKTEKTAKPTEK